MDKLTQPGLPQRFTSLDAHRGFVMLPMRAEVLRLGRGAAALARPVEQRGPAFRDFFNSPLPPFPG